MKLARRRILRLAASAAAIPAFPGLGSAQAYPSRPVHLLVGYAAGGVNDIVARITGQWLSQRLRQQFIIEDRPGAGSNIATEMVVRASPDGYTLLEASTSNAWNATIYQNLSFDFITDIAPVASTVQTYNVLVANLSFPAKTVPELIAYAKANPGKINMGSAGPGSSPHLYGELFKVMAKVDLATVHYRGDGPAIPDLLGGQIQIMFGSVVTWIEQIKAGKVRALAVTSASRTQLLPDLPPVGEFVTGYEGTGWQGIGAPKNTPADIIDRLNGEINAGLVDPRLKSQFANLGAETFPNSPAQFGKFIVEYTEKWSKIIRAAGVKVE
ncbi:MAG TPA: tripartite tricarboxylate transporter substrate binding protein [Xanthobacteraceae bacterium]|jgi:tripartite-type tricarboxylate transporter receptor subunit TctC